MKLMMMLGGLIGFGIGVFFGVLQENSWATTLWQAAVAAYIAGLLMRWWGRVWLVSFKEVQIEQRTAFLATRAKNESSTKPAKMKL